MRRKTCRVCRDVYAAGLHFFTRIADIIDSSYSYDEGEQR